MSEKLEALRHKLHGKMDVGVNRLEKIRNQLSSNCTEAEEAVRARLDQAKKDAEALKQKLADKRAQLRELAEEKKQETESDIADWKAGRELKKLTKRAERAEKYAETCIEIAVVAIAEADEAVLDAICAEIDAAASVAM
jgi:hypothetical protein